MQASLDLHPWNRLHDSVTQLAPALTHFFTPGIGNRRILAALEAFEQCHDERGPFLGRQAECLVQKMVDASVHGEKV